MKGFKFLGIILFGLLILTPKARGNAGCEGQINGGNLPSDSAWYYKVKPGPDSLIGGKPIDISGSGHYSSGSIPSLFLNDTLRIIFQVAGTGPSQVNPLAEVICPIRSQDNLNYPPSIHFRNRSNPTEPRTDFTSYDVFSQMEGQGPLMIAVFLQGSYIVILDSIDNWSITNNSFKHDLHLFSNLPYQEGVSQIKFEIFREAYNGNLDSFHLFRIPQDSTQWLTFTRKFVDPVCIDNSGIANSIYSTVNIMSGVYPIPKPNDVAVDSVNTPSQVLANHPFAVNTFIKNVRWFNSLAPCSLKVITTTGDTIVRIGKADTLTPFESSSITLNLTIPSAGNHKLLAKTYANNDQNLSNDTVSTTIEVLQGEPGWNQLTDVPEGSGKRCKAGTDACTDAYNRIWITKGGTLENYFWTPNLTGSGTWTTATLLPAGQKGKTKKGASLIYANGKIYYKEGYGPGFWSKDTSANASWTPLVNYTIDGKVVKAGTSLAWDNGDLIYMTVGSKNQEKRAVIAIYSISGNNWTNELLPDGLVPKKKFKEGASIVYTPDGFFAAVGHTSELLKRDLSGNWTKATNIPITKKFSGDIAYNPIDNYIYTNEGKNVANFNRYPIAGGAWQNLTAWPSGREAKTPKECALTCSDGIIYGVKGKNTRGFWEYVPSSSLADIVIPNQPENDVQSYPVSVAKIDQRIPTIMNSAQVKSYVGNYRIYRADGREVKSRDLKQGIYFFKSEATGSNTYKVIIAR